MLSAELSLIQSEMANFIPARSGMLRAQQCWEDEGCLSPGETFRPKNGSLAKPSPARDPSGFALGLARTVAADLGQSLSDG